MPQPIPLTQMMKKKHKIKKEKQNIVVREANIEILVLASPPHLSLPSILPCSKSVPKPIGFLSGHYVANNNSN